MHRFFVSKDMIGSDKVRILGEDVDHICKVLRLRVGELITASDGESSEYICKISTLDKKSVTCEIIEKKDIVSEPPVKVHLYQGIPKAAKMDMIVQKCTELGIDTIIPVETERVIAKAGSDRDFDNKLTRWRRIAEEASKQSNRGRIPSISKPAKYKDVLEKLPEYDLVILPYEKESIVGLKQVLKGKNNISSIAIIIGPEGGFENSEVEMAGSKGAAAVTLGPRILRTETAGFTCLSIIMYELGDIGGGPWLK